MNELFDNQNIKQPLTYVSRLSKPNPMIDLYGFGPKDKRCKHCKHLLAFQQGASWFKCDLRKFSHSTATDHKANWESCRKFDEEA